MEHLNNILSEIKEAKLLITMHIFILFKYHELSPNHEIPRHDVYKAYINEQKYDISTNKSILRFINEDRMDS
jgi:hypothetical protein